VTDCEKQFLKFSGYSNEKIENWNDDTEWDFRKEEYFEVYKEGYEQGQKSLICLLADFLHISLTFENPVDVAKRLMSKIEKRIIKKGLDK